MRRHGTPPSDPIIEPHLASISNDINEKLDTSYEEGGGKKKR